MRRHPADLNWVNREGFAGPRLTLPLDHAAKTILNLGLALSLRLIVSYNTQYRKLKSENRNLGLAPFHYSILSLLGK